MFRGMSRYCSGPLTQQELFPYSGYACFKVRNSRLNASPQFDEAVPYQRLLQMQL